MTPALTLKTQQFLQDPSLHRVMAALGTGNALIVGGAVRAAILGQAQADIDIATPLTPAEVTQKLEAAGIKALPTGIDHGTVTAVADHKGFEITTLRRDVETDGRRAIVSFTKDWSEDAQRRDFTMNTLLMDLDGQVFDPTGQGVADLKAGVVRFVGDADTRIKEDALRILRFFRFHARFGSGEADRNALSACVHNATLLKNLSRERVTGEIEKLLVAPYAAESIALMINGKILDGLWVYAFEKDTYKMLQAAVAGLQLTYPDMTLLMYCMRENEVQALKSKVEKFFVLSNKKKEFLIDCIRFWNEATESIVQNLYRFGRDVTLAAMLLSSVFKAKDIGLIQLKAIGEAIVSVEVPVLPVTAADLMKTLNVPEGKALGDLLRSVESWWLAQDGRPDRDACLKQAKTLV